MNGLGFLIWKLSSLPAVEQVIELLQSVNARWVSIKVADGIWPYNQVGGNDKALLAFIGALQAAGIDVGGWHYIYPDQPGPQGDRAEERREKLHLSHYLLDMEKEWKIPYGAGARAVTLCDKLHNGSLQVGLCSYRYPEYHPEPPWGKFLHHEKMDAIVPQLYWIGSHNPAWQIRESLRQYREMSDLPYIPIGSTFDNGDWSPTTDDIAEFIEECQAQGFPGYGFYTLDWIIQKHRTDWLAAIGSGQPAPLPPPAISDELVITNCSWLNGRSEAAVIDDNRVVVVRAGRSVRDLHEDIGNWKHVELGYVQCWMDGNYLEPANNAA